MSERIAAEGVCTRDDGGAIAERVEPRARDLGGFAVARILPAVGRRHVGPFVFLDQMNSPDVGTGAAGERSETGRGGDGSAGGAAAASPRGIDVRPHPHIGLATVTYLFSGAIVHRDSLGSNIKIVPGDINWMTAGRGIVHSERTAPEDRARGGALRGLQLWVALPADREEIDPASLPEVARDGAQIRVLAGRAFGTESPVRAQSPILYADVQLAAGAAIELAADHEERGVLVLTGELTVDGRALAPGPLAVLAQGRTVTLRATADAPARAIVLGGDHVGERHIWWNFVSSSRERIEDAKAQWRERRFPIVPGDDQEFTPLPP
jgi:hypothetical protein